MVTSTSSISYVNPTGEIYLAVGTGGIGYDSLADQLVSHLITDSSGSDKPIADVHFIGEAIGNDHDYGFLDLEVGEDLFSLTGIFYANDFTPEHTSMNDSRTAEFTLFHGFPTMRHKILDYFTISKS